VTDDIEIPPPRTAADAKAWYCSNCGLTGKPDISAVTVLNDPRYAVGTHDCTRPYRGKHPPVQYVADWAFDREKWQAQKDEAAMLAAYLKEQRGSQLKPEEVVLAKRYRVRIGIITNKEAARGTG
jgi:hypothetical protein